MRGKLVIGVCLALACLAITACAKPVDTSAYMGDWKLSSTTVHNLDEKSLALAQSLGQEIKLSLREDNKGLLTLLADANDVMWQAKTSSEGVLQGVPYSPDVSDQQDEGQRNWQSEAAIRIADDQLILSFENGDKLTFTRS